MNFELTPKGSKTLSKLDRSIAERILKKLYFWENTGYPLKYADKIEGETDFFKYRIGDYRIIVLPNFKKGTIDILKIGHRRDVYKSLDNLV